MRRSLIFYFSSEILLSFGIGMATYAQPFLYRTGHISDAAIGLLFALNAASSGVFALFLGPVADRIGASWIFKSSTLLMGLGFLWTGLAGGFLGWVGASILSGMATGLLMSTENVVLSSLSTSKEKAGILSKFVSLYMLLIGLGTVAGGLVSSASSYRMAVLIGAYLSLIAPVVRYFVVAPDAKSNRMFKIPSRKIILMSVYAVLFGTAIGLFRPFATLVLNGHFGLNNALTSSVSAAMLFMVSLGSLLVSPMLRKLRHGPTLRLAFILSVSLTALMAFTGNVTMFVLALLLSTALTSVPGPIVDSMFLDFTPQTEYAQMFGVRVFGNSAGNAIGSYGGGLFMNANALGGLLMMSASLMVVSCLYLLWLLRHVRTARTVQPIGQPNDPTRMPL